jgi:hypothetical protein
MNFPQNRAIVGKKELATGAIRELQGKAKGPAKQLHRQPVAGKDIPEAVYRGRSSRGDKIQSGRELQVQIHAQRQLAIPPFRRH